MNTYFIGIAAILSVKWFYDAKENSERIHTHNTIRETKKNYYNCLAHTLSNNSSDNLHKEGWNNNDSCQSQEKW